MRRREMIEAVAEQCETDGATRLLFELLLDIRELLIDRCKPLDKPAEIEATKPEER